MLRTGGSERGCNILLEVVIDNKQFIAPLGSDSRM